MGGRGCPGAAGILTKRAAGILTKHNGLVPSAPGWPARVPPPYLPASLAASLPASAPGFYCVNLASDCDLG